MFLSELLELDSYNKPKLLDEAGLSRISQHVKNKPIGMITAFRGGNTLQKNRALNKNLAADIRSNGFGFVKLIGRYIEDYDEKDKTKGTPVDEASFFVIGNEGQSGQLKGVLKKLGKKYKQDSVFFKSDENDIGVLIGTNTDGWPGMGVVKKVGKFRPQRVGEFYSKMRGKTFTFEVYQEVMNNFSRSNKNREQ